MRLLISHEAEVDLQVIMNFIGIENANLNAASKILTSIRDLLLLLPKHPHLGRECTELEQYVPDLHCISVEGYIAYYRVRANQIEVARIIHERRDKERIIRWWTSNDHN